MATFVTRNYVGKSNATGTMTGAYGAAPTAGNTLLMAVFVTCNSGSSPASVDTPSGWTRGPSGQSDLAMPGMVTLFWRVAAGNDPAPTVTITSAQFTNPNAVILIEEWAGVHGHDSDGPVNSVGRQTSSPYSVPATVSVSGSGRFVWLFTGLHSGADWEPTFSGGLSSNTSATVLSSLRVATGVGPESANYDSSVTFNRFSGTQSADVTMLAGMSFAANAAPNAPAPLSPVGGAQVSRTDPIVLSATFSDPDPGDSPSASKWQYRLVGGATWTAVTQNNPAQNYSIPAGLAAGDYEWQAAYADQSGTWGPFCSSEFFSAVDPPPGPTWLDPISGQTIGTSSYTGVISTPTLDKSEWTLYADNNGAISSTILQGPVTVTTGDLRSHTFTGLANNTPVWWSVRTSSGGLWSQPVQIRTPVSYTAPAEPTVSLSPDAGSGTLLVGIINPAPGAGEPAASYNDVYVDDGKGLGWERVATMLTPSTAYTYLLPVSGRDYSGAVKVVSIATNGTTAETIA